MGLIELIDERIKKFLDNFSTLNSSPCTVVEVLENEMVKVKLIENGAEYTVPNYSGSSVEVGEKVQLYYKSKNIQAGKSYVGASLNKDSGGGTAEVNDVFGVMNSDDGAIDYEDGATKYIGAIGVKCSKPTNCYVTVNMTASYNNSNYVDVYVYDNRTLSTYQPRIFKNNSINSTLISFSIPLALTQGEHKIYVYIVTPSTFYIDTSYHYVRGVNIEVFETGSPTFVAEYVKHSSNSYGSLYRYIGTSRIPEVIAAAQYANYIYPCCFNDMDLKTAYIPDGYEHIY